MTVSLFFILLLTWLFTYTPITLFNISGCIAAIILGSILGWLHFSVIKIKVVRYHRQIRLPGSWGLLIIIVALFFSMIYFNIDIISFSQQITTPRFAFPLLLLYGFLTGLFIGRFCYARRSLKRGPYVN